MKWLALAVALCACGSDAVKIDEGLRLEYSIRLEATYDPQMLVQYAVRVMRSRIERGHIKATVTARGEMLVVDLAAGDMEVMARAKALLSRTGKLEAMLVDDGAPLMREVCTHVDADSDATARGITTGMDGWRAPDGTGHMDFYLRGIERRDLERYLKELADSDPQFRIPDDHQVVYERVDDPRMPSSRNRSSWRTYYVDRLVRLSNVDFTDARTTVDRETLQPSVLLDLSDRASKSFATLTASIVGRKLAVMIDDRVIMAPIIMTRIDRGHIVLPTTEAAELAIVLASGPLPGPVREERASEIKGDKLLTVDEQGNQVTVPRP